MDHRDLLGDTLKEECGIVGIFTPNEMAASTAFFGLFALQHRGQESAGIAVTDGDSVRMYKDMGLVNQVFDNEVLATLPGDMAVGHVRYSTTGSSVLRNAQPVYCQSLVGQIALAHNGNLVNAHELRTEMEALGEQFESTSDTEIMARILANNLSQGPVKAVQEVMRRCKGAYSVVALLPNMIIGFRDEYGIRPLVVGSIGEEGYMLASETCAFGPVGAKAMHEVKPGEIVLITREKMTIEPGIESPREAMCLFEFIYFARPDSRMYGTGLYSARVRMGEQLATEHEVDADIVIPVPDSGIPAALGYSKRSGIPFREGMVKSRYIHRTFIQPDQRMRELGVRMKLTPLDDHIRGKRLILVDDSIVRGTTTKQIVKMMFESGALEVHVRITAPPIKHPCFYGIDMASKKELAAARMSLEELAEYIGCTSLGFLSVEGAQTAVAGSTNGFCTACFTGNYPLAIPEGLNKNTLDSSVVGEISTVVAGQGILIES